MYRFFKSIFLPVPLLFVFITPLAYADVVVDSENLLRKGDPAGALRLLEDASSSGNVAAKGKLSEYLRTFPAPYNNVPRACTLAREAADAGDAFGAVTRAECLLIGAEKAADPTTLARQLARQAQIRGWGAGGFVLYEVFALDPKYNYSTGGKPDMAKYNALAAMPLAQRGDQIEALNGLVSAMSIGHERAVVTTLGYFVNTEGPGNIDRAINLAALMQRTNVSMPISLANEIKLAQKIKQLGSSQTSVSVFKNAYTSALIAASLQIRGLKSDCDMKDLKIIGIDGGAPVINAVYLPLNKALENTYLMQGEWSETWIFSACEKSASVTMEFTADGWGGAKYASKAIKLSKAD